MSEPITQLLRRFAPAIYGPTVLFALGEGAIMPLLPVIATGLGADVALATLIAAMLVVGQLLGNLPAAWAVARFGERRSMAASGSVALVGAAGVALAPTLFLLAISGFIIGICAAVFVLARHAFMTVHVPFAFRARALALLGGTFRLGMFAGPFIAAALLAVTGSAASAAWFFAVCLLATVVLVWVAPEPEFVVEVSRDPGAAGAGSGPATVSPATVSPAIAADYPPRGEGVFATMVRHRGVLARLGFSAATLAALRSTRQVIIPVWGIAIGADAGTIALVAGLSGAFDFALFYASGQIADRYGRLWTAMPAVLLMSLSFVALSFTMPLASAFVWFVVLSAVLGIGNGLSSGLLLILGADLAPRGNPAPFLGSWHTLIGVGSAAAPLLVAAIAAVSLPAGAAVIGVIGLAGAAGFLRWIPRYGARR
jgi:MFS family permease